MGWLALLQEIFPTQGSNPQLEGSCIGGGFMITAEPVGKPVLLLTHYSTCFNIYIANPQNHLPESPVGPCHLTSLLTTLKQCHGMEKVTPLPYPGFICCLPCSDLVLQLYWSAPGGPQAHQLPPSSVPLLALPSAWNAPQLCPAVPLRESRLEGW